MKKMMASMPSLSFMKNADQILIIRFTIETVLCKLLC